MSLAALASNSWVLQRYVSAPFLLSGRKFDIRVWVLLDSRFNIYLHRSGVLRTSSTQFNMNNLDDHFVHLTNHCIQTQHPDYNKKETGNEIFFPQLQEYLDALPLPTDSTAAASTSSAAATSLAATAAASSSSSSAPAYPHRLCVICHLLPQLSHVVGATLSSVRDRLEGTGDFHSYQLFGYDCVLDHRFHLRLLEINATPASAQALLPDIVAHLKEKAIDSVYPSNERKDTVAVDDVSTAASASAAAAAAATQTAPPGAFSFADLLSRPCHCASMLGGRSKAEYLAPADGSINLFDLVRC